MFLINEKNRSLLLYQEKINEKEKKPSKVEIHFRYEISKTEYGS